jgi:hypothetical protein
MVGQGRAPEARDAGATAAGTGRGVADPHPKLSVAGYAESRRLCGEKEQQAMTLVSPAAVMDAPASARSVPGGRVPATR